VARPLDAFFPLPKMKDGKNFLNRTVFHCDMLFHQRQNVPGEYVNFDEIFIGKELKQITSAVFFILVMSKHFVLIR